MGYEKGEAAGPLFSASSRGMQTKDLHLYISLYVPARSIALALEI